MSLTEAMLAFALAAVISGVTVPAGVSGAVFLLPAQVSLLGMPSPSVTPTNLLYNVIATPAAIVRFRHQGNVGNTLAGPVLLGAVPGVVVGAALRTTVASGDELFRVLVGVLLAFIGARLVSGPRERATPGKRPPRGALTLLGLGTGTIGGLYGIGGGSVLAPVLVILGLAIVEVAAAALVVTLVTSVTGVLAFSLLALAGATEAGPDWTVGIVLGLGGLLGGYVGARLQPRLREDVLRRILGGLALVVGASYLVVALTWR